MYNYGQANNNSGHLLDYIITRKESSSVPNVYVSDFICDHRALHVSLTCNRVLPDINRYISDR